MLGLKVNTPQYDVNCITIKCVCVFVCVWQFTLYITGLLTRYDSPVYNMYLGHFMAKTVDYVFSYSVYS